MHLADEASGGGLGVPWLFRNRLHSNGWHISQMRDADISHCLPALVAAHDSARQTALQM